MASRILYQDHTAAMTTDHVILKGFTKILGLSRRIPVAGISSFRLRERGTYPTGQIPTWGVDDDGVWFTRDRRRFRHHTAVVLTFTNGEQVGFTPAHAGRFRELLLAHGVPELRES